MSKVLPTALIVMFFLAPTARAASPRPRSTHFTLAQVVAGGWRTPAFVNRDRYRHPLKVLEFFRIEPQMTVIELEPGGGWWTEILAPYLKEDGRLIEAIPPGNAKNGSMRRMYQRFVAKMKANPGLYSQVSITPFAPPARVTLGKPDSADRVLTFRNLHNWKIKHVLPQVFRSVYRVLKPGGIFGVVAHRALPYANPGISAPELHRLPEDYVIGLALKTGFRLDGVSEINENPRDPLTINVHRLPPDLAWGDTSAQKKAYKKIGESDRMTLRFIKP